MKRCCSWKMFRQRNPEQQKNKATVENSDKRLCSIAGNLKDKAHFVDKLDILSENIIRGRRSIS